MNRIPSAERKVLADRVARLIANNHAETKDFLEIYRQLEPSRARDEPSGRDHPMPEERLGIWLKTRDEKGEFFTRDESMASQFTYWSRTPEIRCSSSQYRILFFGESVARGFLVDPIYNPGMALQEMLNRSALEAEVIDLARTNCSIAELRGLIAGAKHLNPDMLVIFAGNNWLINSQSAVNEEELGEILKASDAAEALKMQIERRLTAEMDELRLLLDRVKSELNIPVIVINPEFNHGDWRSSEMERVPLFSGEQLPAWEAEKRKALGALSDHDPDVAEKSARAMMQMYPTNPLGFELLGQCFLLRGEADNAYHALVSARDTAIYQPSPCPGVITPVRSYLSSHFRKDGYFLIDLSAVFSRVTGPAAAGRELFLDYCHLTVKGINIAMQEVARQVLRLTLGQDDEPEPSELHQLGPSNYQKAVIHFLAALHNAHWGQNSEIVNFHCTQAMAHADLSDDMADYALSKTNVNCPGRITRHFETLIYKRYFLDYLMLSQGDDEDQTLDLALCDSICRALATSKTGLLNQLDTERLSSVKDGPPDIDLLKPRYWLEYNYNTRLQTHKRTYYKEFKTTSRFFLLCDTSNDYVLEMVYKHPYVFSKEEHLFVSVNGCPVASLDISDTWQSARLAIPRELLMEGTNNLLVEWPLSAVRSETGAQFPADDLDRLLDRMYPVTGELHSLFLKAQPGVPSVC